MKSIKELLQDADPLRYETEIPADWKARTRQTLMKQDIFTTGTCVSDSKAWIGSLIRQIKEFLTESRNPTPRIQTTAAPVEVEELWSQRKTPVPGVLSLLTHAVVIAGLIYLSVAAPSSTKSRVNAGDSQVVLEPLAVPLPRAAVKSGGGGGGVSHLPAPASEGDLPKADTVQIVPPTTVPATLIAEIMVEPTAVDNSRRASPLSPVGLPTGVFGPPLDGPGSGGGIGTGAGPGMGAGSGSGFGPGNGKGSGGGVYMVGGVGGASAPSCPKPEKEPNYTDDARKARIQGTVTLDAVVNSDGRMSVVNISRKLGYGLDDEASRFVEKYFRCKPGLYKGKAVATSVKIDVNFHLY